MSATKLQTSMHGWMKHVLSGDTPAAVEFLRQFYPNGPFVLTAIDPHKKGLETKSFTIDQVDDMSAWIDKWSGKRNLYFSVAEPIRPKSSKLLRTDIKRVWYLHVDIDPRAGENLADEQERCKNLVTTNLPEGVPKPTAVVFSGGGYQAFWRLKYPIVIDGDLEKAEEAKLFNVQLERLFRADNVHNIDRIMRLPGTINIPDAKKVEKGRVETLAELMHFDGDIYDNDTFIMAPPVKDPVASGPSSSATQVIGGAAYTVENLRNATPCLISTMEDVPVKARAIALHGVDAEIDNPPNDTSASGWLFSMLATCTSAGVPTDVIAGICKSDELHHSLKAHIARNNGDRYIAGQIENALQKFPHVVGGKSEPFSDDHLALTFAKAHKNDLRYCAITGKWYRWTGSLWEREETLLAWDLVKQVLRQAASFLPDDAGSFKRGLLSKSRISSVESLARSDRRIAIRIEDFDASPMLLNTPDGVVDLSTGNVLPSSPDFYMTKQTAIGPENGKPVRFLDFLNWATNGDPEFVAYIRRIMGYCLTGSTIEHALFFVHGAGGNGKSVLQEIMQWLMADYATTTTFDTLAVTSGGPSHPTDLASMKGARLVVAPETESNTRWAEAKVKRMTGGDIIAARFMRQDFFEFMPQFKLFVVGNHRPGFVNVDHAIRRRVHLLPFTQTIAEKDMVRGLGTILKEEEGSRILNWAIEGTLDWHDNGLQPPAAVSGATDKYLTSEDVIANWASECTEPGRAEFKYLYACYVAWCEQTNERGVLTKRKFGDQLSDRGWPPEVGAGNVAVRDLDLNEEGMQLAEDELKTIKHRPEAGGES